LYKRKKERGSLALPDERNRCSRSGHCRRGGETFSNVKKKNQKSGRERVLKRRIEGGDRDEIGKKSPTLRAKQLNRESCQGGKVGGTIDKKKKKTQLNITEK